jgi:hypothetical protein
MFARSHDSLVRSSSQGHISIGSMLSQGDDGTFKGPGIFFYTKGMPVMLLENLLTPFKLVNGRIGKAVDVVVEHIKNVMELRFGGRNFRRMSKSVRSLRKKRKRPARIQKFFIRSDSDVFDLNDRYVLCSRPPACVIVEYDEPTGLTFPGLAPNQHPFFPRKYSSTIKDLITRKQVKVRRTQVPLTPAFATTDYKAQGATLEELETSLAFSKLKRGSAQKLGLVPVLDEKCLFVHPSKLIMVFFYVDDILLFGAKHLRPDLETLCGLHSTSKLRRVSEDHDG